MLRVSNIDLSPRRLMQNYASPQGPLPPPQNAQGGSEAPRAAFVALVRDTLVQVNAARADGVGGRIDLLG